MSEEIKPKKIGPGEAVCDPKNCPKYAGDGKCKIEDGDLYGSEDPRFEAIEGKNCGPWDFMKMQIMSRGYHFRS